MKGAVAGPRAMSRLSGRLPGGVLLVALMILLLLLACQLWLSYRDQIRTAETGMHNFAAIFEARLDATLRRNDADLETLSHDIPIAAVRRSAVASYAAEVNARLDDRLFNAEEMSGYRVHDASGEMLYTSDAAGTQRVNIADRPYFRQLRDGLASGSVFSDVVADRGSGRQVLVIARALRDEDGRFLGVISGLLRLAYYAQHFRSLDLGEHGFVALRRRDDHALIVRWPESPGEPNQTLAPSHPIVSRMAAGAGVLTLLYHAEGDGIARIVGVRTMQNYPFYFAVGVGRNEVLSGWYVQAGVVGVSALLLLGLLGVLFGRLWRMRIREAGILGTLAQSELKFRELAQMVPVGICHLDQDGIYTYVNDRHLAMTGRRRSELLGSAWSDFVHPDDRSKLMGVRAAGGGAGQPFVCEYRLLRPDGQTMHVIGDVTMETAPDGGVLGYIVAQTDITRRKDAEAQLLVAKQQAESANITKTRFLAAASHDLRQPIQAISLFSDALGRTELNAEQKTLTRFLSMSVRSLGELLYALLDISKLDAGLVRPQMKAVPVEEVFMTIDEEFSTLARQQNLRFKLFYPFKELCLLTDQGLLLSVLRNLIDNAFKYTKSGGVLVGARKRSGDAVIQVWDTGIGIEAKYGEKVFDECFQIDNPLQDRTKGLGIGLSIARRMAGLLRGSVTFRSRPGRGTVFEIVLPLAAAPESAGRKALPVPQADGVSDDSGVDLRGWRVVVVEDDPVVAKSIELLLQAMAVSVSVFTSAESALDSPDIMAADFYISDFSLPGINGLQLLDTIQQRSPLPIDAVLLTGETSPERIRLATSSRWRVLFKPAELAQLMDVMSKSERASERTSEQAIQ
jgi:PAS domain S-box-containing protein